MSIPFHHSSEARPGDRGRGLGAAQADRIAANWRIYARLFDVAAGLSEDDTRRFGAEAFERIAGFAPELAEEIEGIAEGSGRPTEEIAALNARTELLAAGGHECSVVACMGTLTRSGDPIGVQTWDWHDELSDGWMHWRIDHADGRRVDTMTEAGIVAKLGVSSAGVGLLMNILGHAQDGPPLGIPVHVLNRAVLDRSSNGVEAVTMLANAPMSASSSVTIVAPDGDGGVVCTVELSPAGPGFVTPDQRGVLVHTNHFLEEPGRSGDTAVREAPNTVLRLDHARRSMARLDEGEVDAEAIIATLDSHRGGGPGGSCCHPAADAAFGDRWRTLATVIVEPAQGRMTVRRNGPCGHERLPQPAAGAAAR